MRVSLHGCILLNQKSDNNKDRRYLIFGGRHHQTFIIHEDLGNFQKSYIQMMNNEKEKGFRKELA